MSITFPNIDPIMFEIGFLKVHWYSMAYIAGFMATYFYFLRVIKKDGFNFLSLKAVDSLLNHGILGIILGGRIGYTLFYNFSYYSTNYMEIIKIWKGGMSFHGAVIGLIISIFLFSRKNKISYLYIFDIIASIAPLGIFLGRIANFINAELYGRVTDVSWGVVFPNSDGLPRHPSQLYEAFFEGLLLLIIINLLRLSQRILRKHGFLTGVFCIGYSLSRFFIEYYREPDIQLGFILNNITMGQILTLPLFVIGIILLIRK